MDNFEKKYKEALERAKKLHKDAITLQLEQDIKDYEHIFPELAESEDERIRKTLIDFFSKGAKYRAQTNGIYDKDIIAWLEKQGERKPVNDTDEDIVEAVKDTSILDLVEPKFHKGEWVIDKQGMVHQIANVVENVTNHTYGYDIVGGGYFNDNTEGVRLWTIQDAKEGDVLYCESSGIEFIIILKQINNRSLDSYCRYNTIDGFAIDVPRVMSIQDNPKPATKEQRDLLFQKMKEAGYEWDAEKKELSKRVIDEGKGEMDYCFTKMMNSEKVSSTWGKEDEQNLNAVLSYINDEYLCRWLKDVIHVKYDKPAWSEEDERMCQETIDWFEKKCFPYALEHENPARESIKWLKFLKERIK